MPKIPPEIIRYFQFDNWPRLVATDTKCFFWRLVIGPQLLKDWELVRQQEEFVKPGTRYTMTVWKPKVGASLLRVDVYEEPSAHAAEHRLLDLLTSCQSPEGRRDDKLSYPLFRDGEDTTVFARGNLSFFVANAEREQVSLKPVLADIEKLYAPRLPETPGAIVPRIYLAKPTNIPAKVPIEFAPKADYPLRCWYLIESKLGEVTREEDHLVYFAPTAGMETVAITAVGTDGQATRVEQTFPVEYPK